MVFLFNYLFPLTLMRLLLPTLFLPLRMLMVSVLPTLASSPREAATHCSSLALLRVSSSSSRSQRLRLPVRTLLLLADLISSVLPVASLLRNANATVTVIHFNLKTTKKSSKMLILLLLLSASLALFKVSGLSLVLLLLTSVPTTLMMLPERAARDWWVTLTLSLPPRLLLRSLLSPVELAL